MKKRTRTVVMGCIACLTITACKPYIVSSSGNSALGFISTGSVNNVSDVISDEVLEKRIYRDLSSSKHPGLSSLQVIVFQKKAILIGYLPSKKEQQLALDIAKTTENILEVFNETKIGVNETTIGNLNDSWISTKISLTLSQEDINKKNYRYVVVDGVVYICGSAESKKEKEKALEVIRSIKGVSSVKTYIVLASKNA